MQVDRSVKSYIHDVVSRLLELHSLEERLTAFPPNRDERTHVESLIESLRANLPLGVVTVHDQMKTRGKRSVAEVRHGICSGCHIALGIGNAHQIKTGSLRRCGNCGRYLYLVEEDDKPTPAKPTRNAHNKSTATPSK